MKAQSAYQISCLGLSLYLHAYPNLILNGLQLVTRHADGVCGGVSSLQWARPAVGGPSLCRAVTFGS